MIRFQCPGCQATYTVGDEKAGKQGKCPKCQSAFVIPGTESPPAPPPPPPPPPAEEAGIEIAPCPKCGTRLTVSPGDIGLNVQCPSCSTTFQAARPGAMAPPPPPQTQSRAPSFDVDGDEDDEAPRSRKRRRRRKPDAPRGLVAILLFKYMITPFVIQIVFWVAIVVIMVMGLLGLITTMSTLKNMNATQAVVAIGLAIFTPPAMMLGARIYAELIILFFRIHETLVDIKYQGDVDD